MMDQLFQDNVNESNNDIISIDQLVAESNTPVEPVTNQTVSVVDTQPVVTPAPVTSEAVPKKKDKILTIQITLIIVWAILTALVYFFGYDLFEPFIKV